MTTLRPIAWVLASTNHGSMLVNRHDYRLVGDSGYGVGHQLLTTGSFDQPEVDLLLQLLTLRRQHHPGRLLALDCGANIGVHTVEWARHMHDWGEVIAIEAQERIFYALAGNLSLNNCFNARAIWAAVGGKPGHIAVPQPDYFKPSSFGSLELRPSGSNEFIGQAISHDPAHTQQTRMVTIDELRLPRLDLLKLDIEGMEVEALQGARQSIAANHPLLLIEHIKSDRQALEGFLQQQGYRSFALGLNLLGVHQADPVLQSIQFKPA